MKRNLLVFLFLPLVLLSSCLKGDFSAYSSSFERRISVVDGKPTDEVKFIADLSEKDGSYTFKMTSPGDALSWEGKLYDEDGLFVSDALLITPGALFPAGEYRVQINADSGNTTSTTIFIPSVENWKNAEEIEEGSDIQVSYVDAEGNSLEKKEGSKTASFSYVDRYKNHVTIIESR